jgi:predicted nucleic-acid-binding protein
MARSAAIQKLPSQQPRAQGEVVETTLLELVQTVGELTPDDREVVATVIEMLHSGRVRLVGNFRGQRIALA